MFKKYFNRFPNAFAGLAHALLHDFGFRTQVYLGLAVGLFVGVFFYPLSIIELLFLALAWTLILITELQNSALETTLDRLHPEHHESIKHSKDMAAASVLVAGLFLILVLLVIAYTRLL